MESLRKNGLVSERFRRRGLLASDLHSGAWVLRVHTEIDVRTEAHAKRVGRHLNAFDDWRAATLRNIYLKRR